MKYYLLNAQQITFPAAYNQSVENFGIIGPILCKNVKIPTALIEMDKNPNNPKNNSLLQKSFLMNIFLRPNSEEEIWNIDLSVGIQEEQAREEDILKGYVKLDGKCLQVLGEMSEGTASVKLQLDFLRQGHIRGAPASRIITKEMPIVGSICADYPLEFPFSHFWNWDCESFRCVCTIIVTATNGLVPKSASNEAPKKISTPQKMLEEEILSDVVLVAENGAMIKAHKSFLAVHSSVFLAMFQSDMEEAREPTVEIPDMTEESVRALLKFVYYEDLEAAEGDSLIAFELFSAGHKYDINELEKSMREMLLRKENDWFDMDVAVKVFLFARNLTPVDEEMKTKAIKVLKLHLGKLEESPTYQEIFEKDKKAAMELCKYAFAT